MCPRSPLLLRDSGTAARTTATRDSALVTGEEVKGLDHGQEIWGKGAEGQVVVPWATTLQGDMKASPDTVGIGGELPEHREGEKVSYTFQCRLCTAHAYGNTSFLGNFFLVYAHLCFILWVFEASQGEGGGWLSKSGLS